MPSAWIILKALQLYLIRDPLLLLLIGISNRLRTIVQAVRSTIFENSET